MAAYGTQPMAVEQATSSSWSIMGSAVLIAVGTLLVLSSSTSSPEAAYGTAALTRAHPIVGSTPSSRIPMELNGRGRAASKRMKQMTGQRGEIQKPQTPAVDPENEEFVIFVRAKTIGTRWFPLTIVTGGTQANNLVKASKGALATDMFKNQLIRSIGEVIYRDQVKIEKQLRAANVPGMAVVKEFEYGFTIRDKTNPDKWMDDSGVIVIPPKDQLPETPINKVADGVRGIAEKFGFGKKKEEGAAKSG
eukprot:EG_transcript_17920